MPHIVFVEPNGQRKKVDVGAGTSVMRAALIGGVAGIVGECGGSAMCATCHVFVEDERRSLIPPPSPIEEDMLDFAAAERRENSRLGCQIIVTDELDGLVVAVANSES
jgi:2Fe-2S ferredoxin